MKPVPMVQLVALQVSITERLSLIKDKTLIGLHELVTYGLKGSAAYGK